MTLLDRWRDWQRRRDVPGNIDPDLLLTQAERRMRDGQARNRERAVAAFTMRNRLEIQVETARRRLGELRERIGDARAEGDESAASLLIRDEERCRETLEAISAYFEQASTAADDIKRALLREEDEIRQKTAQALVLRAQWKLTRIEQALTVSLAQLSVDAEGRATHQELRERHRRSRLTAAEAVLHKNRIERLVTDARRNTDRLGRLAAEARRVGDGERERHLLRDLEQHEAALAATRSALALAEEVTERAAFLLNEEGERLRVLGGSVPAAATAGAPDDDPAARRRLWTLILLAGLVLLRLILWQFSAF
jgi:phage shock protein A